MSKELGNFKSENDGKTCTERPNFSFSKLRALLFIASRLDKSDENRIPEVRKGVRSEERGKS